MTNNLFSNITTQEIIDRLNELNKKMEQVIEEKNEAIELFDEGNLSELRKVCKRLDPLIKEYRDEQNVLNMLLIQRLENH